MVGLHVTLDYYGCDSRTLRDAERLRAVLATAAEKGGLQVRGEVAHEYEPEGFSAVLLLAESHLSIHTWPEVGFAAVDLFSCKKATSVDAVQEYIRTALNAVRCRRTDIPRGAEITPAVHRH